MTGGCATVPCKWCSTPTEMLGTRECDRCHEAHLFLRATTKDGAAEKIVSDVLGIRPAVLAFAQAMEQALRAHDVDRGPQGWLGEDTRGLWERAMQEMAELHDEVMTFERGARRNSRETMKEAADVGNFAMMIFDVAAKEAKERP